MEKLLITGVDGVLGSNLALGLSEFFSVVGLYDRHPVELDGCLTESFNWQAATDVREYVVRHRPDWVIHCGPQSLSSWDDVPESPDEAFAKNSDVVTALADATESAGCAFTVMGTDAVFTGPRLFHHENDKQCGECLLGRAAREIEEQLRGTHALVVRTHAYGWAPTEYQRSYAEDMWHALAGGEPCRVDADRHATPILATDLVEPLCRAYDRKLRGTWHITGAERTSPFRFAAELARAFGLAGRHVRLEAPDARSSNRRPNVQEASLVTRRARKALGLPMPMLREGLARFAEQASNGYRGHLAPSRVHEWTRQKAA